MDRQVVVLIKPSPDPDPRATLFRAVRDAAKFTEGVTNADRIAVLELVRAELVNDLLGEIHG